MGQNGQNQISVSGDSNGRVRPNADYRSRLAVCVCVCVKCRRSWYLYRGGVRTPLWCRGGRVGGGTYITWQNLNNSANIDRIDMKLVPKVAQEKVQFDGKTGKIARHTPFSEFSKNESSCDIDFGQNWPKCPKSAKNGQNRPKMAKIGQKW